MNNQINKEMEKKSLSEYDIFNWADAKKHCAPLVMLSPMSGYTDSPYRRIVKEVNPEVLCFTELLSADGVHFGGERTIAMMKHHKDEKPLIIQLFGKEKDYFVEAAKASIANGAAGIDINMGCPARKVVNSGHGSSLIRIPEVAYDIVRSVSEAIAPYPVSVKTRLGWIDSRELCAFVEGLIEAGAKSITLHGRTVKQMYQGEADWLPIFRVKHHVQHVMGRDDIPVFGNGDVTDAVEGKEKIYADYWIDKGLWSNSDWRENMYPRQVALGATNVESPENVERLSDEEVAAEIEKFRGLSLDGFMIGRSSFGNPWIFDEAQGSVNTEDEVVVEAAEVTADSCDVDSSEAESGAVACADAGKLWKSESRRAVASSEVLDVVTRHAQYMTDYFGETTGIKMMRKILPHYFSGFPGAKDLRARLVQVEGLEDVKNIVSELRD